MWIYVMTCIMPASERIFWYVTQSSDFFFYDEFSKNEKIPIRKRNEKKKCSRYHYGRQWRQSMRWISLWRNRMSEFLWKVRHAKLIIYIEVVKWSSNWRVIFENFVFFFLFFRHCVNYVQRDHCAKNRA